MEGCIFDLWLSAASGVQLPSERRSVEQKDIYYRMSGLHKITTITNILLQEMYLSVGQIKSNYMLLMLLPDYGLL